MKLEAKFLAIEIRPATFENAKAAMPGWMWRCLQLRPGTRDQRSTRGWSGWIFATESDLHKMREAIDQALETPRPSRTVQ